MTVFFADLLEVELVGTPGTEVEPAGFLALPFTIGRRD